jgi:hypothetical protein
VVGWLVVCLAGASIVAGQGTPEDPLKGLEVKPLAVGTSTTYYFVHKGAGRQMGYSELSLAAVERAGRTAYDYRHLTVLKFGRERTTTLVEAALTDRFVPQQIRVTQDKVPHEGAQTSTKSTAIIEEQEIVLTKATDGRVETQRVPRPEKPFVYGLALLVEHIDFEKNEEFQLAELNPEDGTAFEYTLALSVVEGRQPMVRATWGIEGGAFFFFLNDEGSLDGWAQIPPQLEVRRATKEQVEELKKKLKLD